MYGSLYLTLPAIDVPDCLDDGFPMVYYTLYAVFVVFRRFILLSLFLTNF